MRILIGHRCIWSQRKGSFVKQVPEKKGLSKAVNAFLQGKVLNLNGHAHDYVSSWWVCLPSPLRVPRSCFVTGGWKCYSCQRGRTSLDFLLSLKTHQATYEKWRQEQSVMLLLNFSTIVQDSSKTFHTGSSLQSFTFVYWCHSNYIYYFNSIIGWTLQMYPFEIEQI